MLTSLYKSFPICGSCHIRYVNERTQFALATTLWYTWVIGNRCLRLGNRWLRVATSGIKLYINDADAGQPQGNINLCSKVTTEPSEMTQVPRRKSPWKRYGWWWKHHPTIAFKAFSSRNRPLYLWLQLAAPEYVCCANITQHMTSLKELLINAKKCEHESTLLPKTFSCAPLR